MHRSSNNETLLRRMQSPIGIRVHYVETERWNMDVKFLTIEEAKGFGELMDVPAQARATGESALEWGARVMLDNCGIADLESREIKSSYGDKVYRQVEIHYNTTQLFITLEGEMALAVGSTEKLGFVRLPVGKAFLVSVEAPHASPLVLSAGGARFLVISRKGTKDNDCIFVDMDQPLEIKS